MIHERCFDIYKNVQIVIGGWKNLIWFNLFEKKLKWNHFVSKIFEMKKISNLSNEKWNDEIKTNNFNYQ